MSEEAVFGLVGVALGFILAEGSAWLTRRRTRAALWRSLEVEVEFIRSRVEGFVEDRIQSPLYRLPQECFRTALPKLLEDGSLEAEDTSALMTFYSEVETFNRGLEQAAAAPNAEQRAAEFGRLAEKKAPRIVGTGSAYQTIHSAIVRRTR
jgi:hypothetical protein